MSEADRERWNARYSTPSETPPQACALLAEYAWLLPQEGLALDLACGRGGNALLLARRGWRVEAWDIAERALEALDSVAMAEGLALTTVQADLDDRVPPPARYDLIVVSGYLNRPLCPALVQALRPGGLLFYQTFTRIRPVAGPGPSNPDFLLAPGELLRLFRELIPVFYRDLADIGDPGCGLRNQAQLIARRA